MCSTNILYLCIFVCVLVLGQQHSAPCYSYHSAPCSSLWATSATMASFEDEMKALCVKHGKDPDKTLKKDDEATIEIPPEVKKVVVEHLISDKGSSSSVHRRKLRLFSGSKPTPHGGINFASWRVSASQILDVESINLHLLKHKDTAI